MADAAFSAAFTAVNLIMELASQDIESSLNSLDLAGLNNADGTRGLLTFIAHELKDTKLVVAAEDATVAEDVRALAQAAQASKRQLEHMLSGMGDLACLKQDIACMTRRNQAQSPSTDTELLELDYLTQVVAVLDEVASTHSAIDAKEQAVELGPLEGFICPLSLDIMRDPVIITGSGQTCQRTLAEHWFAAGNTTCPITGVQLSSAQLIPNYALRGAVEDWLNRRSTITSPATSPTTGGASVSAPPQGSNQSGNFLAALGTSVLALYQVQAARSTPASEDEIVLQSRGDARKLCALVQPGMSMSI
eukprot:jgi/Chlat1/8541/Chrsp82S07941